MFPRPALTLLVALLACLSHLQVDAKSLGYSQLHARLFTIDDHDDKIDQELGPHLSSKATIVHDPSAAPRWSDYHAPNPGTIVNVAEENDVVETVKYCIENNITFLAQSGGHGRSTTFNIGKNDVIINMRGLNQVTVSENKDSITIGGGILVSELVDAVSENLLLAVSTNCNCVGIMGALLGGGIGPFMPLYGLTMDSLLSVNLVTAEGKLLNVSSTSYPDLWWAIRGAGANFGIVTSAVLKAYPPLNGDNKIWMATLTFSPDKLEAVAEIFNEFDYKKEIGPQIRFYGSPLDSTLTLVVTLPYIGSEAQGKLAFQALYDLEPIASTSQTVDYADLNNNADSACEKGGRKPGYAIYLNKLDPKALREVWNEYVSARSKDPNFSQTLMIFDAHSTAGNSDSAFAFRDSKFVASLYQSYTDAKLDSLARETGIKIRSLFDKSSGFDELRCYINESYGDETSETIYGSSLPRLKKLKKIWDPKGRFSQFFPIPLESEEESE